MTTERKQELTQLLEDALENLEIRNSENQILLKEKYRGYLQEYWSSYSSYSLPGVMISYPILASCELHITSKTTQSNLLDFMKEAFKDAIHEGRIQSACTHVIGGLTDGYSLDSLLKRLLDIAISWDVKRAVSAFERGTEDKSASFQYRLLLAGIEVDDKIPDFDGIRIKPLPSPIPNPLRLGIESIGMSHHVWRAQLIIDASVSPIFHKPDLKGRLDAFQLEICNRYFRKTELIDLGTAFSHALALVCDSPVHFCVGWTHIENDELFYLWRSYNVSGPYYSTNIENTMPVGKSQIAGAVQLCKILTTLSPNIGRKMQIPIDRWMKSKTSQTFVDQMIDLGIAFEALYLPKGNIEQLSLHLRLRAAWHLGEDKQGRKRLRDEFKEIYKQRSKAVHNGEIDKEIKIGEAAPLTTLEFIQRAQDLCRAAIMKILEDGEVPDWDDLILGE